MAEERTFTEAQHFALLTDAVARETATLSTVKEELESKTATLESEKAALAATNSDLQSRIDVLDAEKAAAEAARDLAQAEFTAHKAAETEKADAEARKSDRLSRVKAANSTLSDDYFTEPRVQRWAEMAEDTFEALVVDITEAAAAMGLHKFKPGSGDTPATECATCGKTAKAGMHMDAEDLKDGGKDEATEKALRETAAFKGGDAITAGTGTSLFGQFMQKTGHAPVSV